MKQATVLTAILLFFYSYSAFAQADSSAAPIKPVDGESGISLSVRISDTTVPMNHTVNVVFELKWYGDLDRYEIFPFDNPIINNFEIIANSSSNKVTTIQGKSYATREYVFTLQPQALGMGYVESIIIRYTDLSTDSDMTLTTNRVEIKVTDRVAEPGDKTWLIWVFAGLLLTGGAVYAVINMQKRKSEKLAIEREQAEKNRPVEEVLLEELKAAIKMNDPALDVINAVSTVTKILRRYIAEKFGIAVESKPTEDIIKELKFNVLEPKFLEEIENILTMTDILKFSGNQATKQELERIYGLLESNLYKSLRGEIEIKPEANEETEND